MVIVARVRRYTQQKDQLWSGHCQAVRGTEGQGSYALVQLCPGQRRAHLAACDTPLHRRWQVESAGSMFIGRMAAGPHSAQTISVWEGGSRYGRYACTYPAPTGEMQGANRIAWRNALSRQTGIARVSGKSDDGWLGARQLVQGVGSGAGG